MSTEKKLLRRTEFTEMVTEVGAEITGDHPAPSLSAQLAV